MIGTARSEFPAAKYCHCHHEAMASSSRAVDQVFPVTQKSLFLCKWTTNFRKNVDLFFLKNLIKRLKWIFPLKMVIFHSFLYVILQFPQLPNFNRFLFSAKAGGFSCLILFHPKNTVRALRLSCHMCSTSTSNLEPWGGPKSPKHPKHGLRWPNCALICGFDFKSSPHSCNKNS